MLNLRKKLLVGLLTASIVLSVGSGVVWSESDGAAADTSNTTSEDTGDTAASDSEADGSGADAAVPVTEDQAFSEMTLYAENSKLALYVNEATCVFAVVNKSNNYIWWSTPYDVDTDPIAKGAQIKSLRSMVFYDAGDPNNHNSSKVTVYDQCVQKENFTVEKIENGAKFTFNIKKNKITIPVYITLSEDSFEARIPCDEIDEKSREAAESAYELLDLTLLNGLGSAPSSEDGYIFVPDGSGAVINFNNGKTTTSVYDAPVYGRDLGVSETELQDRTEQIYLPVFGIVREGTSGDNALFAVITDGDAYASINANVSGQATTSYNSVYPSFTMRSTDSYKIGTKEPLTVYEAGAIKIDDIAVRYYVLNSANITVANLADTYRNYLISEQGLTKKTDADYNTLFLRVLGGTVKAQSVAGFPVNMQTVATTYSQALEIAQLLEAAGVDDLNMVYNDYSNCGMTGQITTGVDYSGKLGGKGDFTTLYDYFKNNNGTLYPSVDFMEYTRSGNGYSFTLNACKQITKSYATQQSYWLNYGYPNVVTRSAWTILSPYYWPDVFEKLVSSYTAEGITSISLNQATSTLYSDFSRTNYNGGEYFTRHVTEQMLVDGCKKFNDAGISIHAQACNAYLLPYVASISDVPLYSSNYDVFDYDVPFYQMVIHGYIPYSSKPINASANADELLLLSVLTGSSVQYEVMYSDPNDFTDSEYDEYFYTYYKGWIDEAASQYKLLNDTVSAVSDSTITKFVRNSATELAVTYSNGTTITVNTAKRTVKVGTQEFSLADYGLEGVSE